MRASLLVTALIFAAGCSWPKAVAADDRAPAAFAQSKAGGRILPAKLQQDNPHRRVYVGPGRKADFPAWLEGMKKARADAQRAIRSKSQNAPPSVYDDKDLAWTRESFVQTKIMVHDRCFYDHEAQRYTVDRCLDYFTKLYGGVDRVLLWPHYPNMGVDARSQFDFFRDMPGGLDGLREVVSEFHRRNVKVCLPLLTVDFGVRPEGELLEDAMAKLMRQTQADCAFADSIAAPDKKYFTAGAKEGVKFALEPEGGFADSDWRDENQGLPALYWTPLSWAYAVGGAYLRGEPDYSAIPGVDRFKWIEPRHMPCVTLRQEKDHIHSLQYAFFNGVCFNAWENIFGVWNGITPRAAEALRRMALVYRAFAPYFSSADWEPHTPTVKEGVYASKFPGPGGTVWTLINKNPQEQTGAQITIPYGNQTFYDLWNGEVLQPDVKDGQATLSFPIEGHGFAAIFASPQRDPKLEGLLAQMAQRSSQKLASVSNDWRPLQQTMVPIGRTAAHHQAPPGMVTIPANPYYHFEAEGLVIEPYAGAGVQFPWESSPRMEHEHTLAIASFHIDKHLVTNDEFKTFLQQTDYQRGLKEWDRHNFLKHWTMEGEPSFAPGAAKKPVVWVSLEDARAYCQWAGKRLPNDWEWQYAAQGNDSRPFPWGKRWDAAKVPKKQIRRLSTPEDVGRRPAGASRFGVQDLIGHVWQWTNEFHDQGTRRALVRGGSYYCPDPKGGGVGWSFPQTAEDGACETNRLNEHGNYLLMSPSLDRSETIGLRCVADAE